MQASKLQALRAQNHLFAGCSIQRQICLAMGHRHLHQIQVWAHLARIIPPHSPVHAHLHFIDQAGIVLQASLLSCMQWIAPLRGHPRPYGPENYMPCNNSTCLSECPSKTLPTAWIEYKQLALGNSGGAIPGTRTGEGTGKSIGMLDRMCAVKDA